MSEAIFLPLTKGHVAIIDSEDVAQSKFKWTAQEFRNGKVYAYRKINKRTVYLHRVILGIVDFPGYEADHIDGNGVNDRRSNLRITTRNMNSKNQTTKRKGSSRFKGVVHSTWTSKRWCARITVNGKFMNLGRYFTEEEAAHAYDEAARKYFGDYAHLNFPYTSQLGPA